MIRVKKIYTPILDFLIFSLQTCISELEALKLTVTDIRRYELTQTAVLFGYKHSLFTALSVRSFTSELETVMLCDSLRI